MQIIKSYINMEKLTWKKRENVNVCIAICFHPRVPSDRRSTGKKKTSGKKRFQKTFIKNYKLFCPITFFQLIFTKYRLKKVTSQNVLKNRQRVQPHHSLSPHYKISRLDCSTSIPHPRKIKPRIHMHFEINIQKIN